MFTVRPLQRPPGRHIFRIHVSATALVLLKLQAGDLCLLHIDDNIQYAMIWPAAEKIQDSIVQTSKPLQELYGLKLGDKIDIARPEDTHVPSASAIQLHEHSSSAILSREDRLAWQWILKRLLPSEHEALAASQRLTVKLWDEERAFIVRIPNPLVRTSKDTSFVICDAPNGASAEVLIPSTTIGGLDQRIEQIQGIISAVQFRPRVLPHFYKPPAGVLLYGAKGTGKSLLIDTIANAGWKEVVRWTSGNAPNVEHRQEPFLVIIDDLEVKAAPSTSSNTVLAIRKLFDSIRGRKALVLAEARHPNNIDESLRATERFREEIEVPVPTQNDRYEVMKAIRADSAAPEDEWLRSASTRTHGYVGADLRALLYKATEIAMERLGSYHRPLQDSTDQCATAPDLAPDGAPNDDSERPLSHPNTDTDVFQYTVTDLDSALSQVRPSALQEVFLETPNVHYSDIGGQHAIKQRLQESVEWPLKRAEEMRALDLTPTKGILLHGPPGCSKTLLVKALAREAGLNFLAVKGAELISMYVGESERAVREVFRKARAAQPSIVFFDEVDAIASRADGGGGGGGNAGLNVLTTLLNEMDGFEELRGVMVVAATNKPWRIDEALVRPGRLDQVVYVGPPDHDTRREILARRFGRSRVDADAGDIATRTEGFSGAEVVGICEVAGRRALRARRDRITTEDLLQAIEETPKGITDDLLKEFEDWNARRR